MLSAPGPSSKLPPMFALPRVLHFGPADIGDLGFPDFLTLSSMADEWLEMEIKSPRL